MTHSDVHAPCAIELWNARLMKLWKILDLLDFYANVMSFNRLSYTANRNSALRGEQITLWDISLVMHSCVCVCVHVTATIHLSRTLIQNSHLWCAGLWQRAASRLLLTLTESQAHERITSSITLESVSCGTLDWLSPLDLFWGLDGSTAEILLI